jgi:hypothetical protein
MPRYVVYEVESTRYAGRKGSYGEPIFESMAAAKSHVTRLLKKGKYKKRSELGILSVEQFRKIEKKEVRKHLMTGEDMVVSVNTPGYLCPSSESYWSM